mgnify:FL=1
MGERIFVDANVFIALLNERDALHRRAVEVVSAFRERDLLSVTSNFVISEVITVLSQRSGKRAGLFFADSLYGEKAHIQVITVDPQVEMRALDYLRMVESKNVSFCDCVSLALMEVFGIKKIATFDRDFRIKNAPYEIIG